MSIASLSYDINNSAPIGLTTIENASKMLADFGRNGDTYVVHAKEGETVIPMEVLDNNPRLKNMLFQQMRELDLDPNRYIVGNELNSINPVTGQPEFFIKKLFKGIKNVVKKLAPVVLPIAAPFLLPTMPLFLSTGIGTLAGGIIGGQKPKDALRNAVVAGGLAGLGNMAFGQGGFSGSAIDAGLTKGDLDVRNLFGRDSAKGTVGSLQSRDTSILGVGGDPMLSEKALLDKATTSTRTFQPKETGILDTITDSTSNFYDKYLSPSRTSIQADTSEVMKRAKEVAGKKFKAFDDLGVKLSKADEKKILMDAFTAQEKALAPSAFSKYGPLTGLTLAGLYGLDEAGLPIFTVKEEEGQGNFAQPLTGLDLLRQNPEKYGFTDFYGSNPYYQNRAEGGEIVGPGTETSDSIPAMLSDGEFVMNAKAVKGAGGGDRKEGAKRMYAMMKKFEKVA